MIMMPIIGMFTGGASFADKVYELAPAIPEILGEDGSVITAGVPANNLQYGAWIDTIISLIIVGFVLFMIVKAVNKAKKKKVEAPAGPPAPTKEEVLLGEIRDLLKK